MVVGGRAVLGHATLAFSETREEIADVDLEEAGDVPELGRRNAVGAFFVLLDLLEGQTKRPAEVALVVAQADPLLADLAADKPVNGMGTVFPSASSHLLLAI